MPPTDQFESHTPTPVRGVAVIDAELARLEHEQDEHAREISTLKNLRALLLGMEGQPGTLTLIHKGIEDMKAMFGKLSDRVDGHDHIFTKIIAVAGAASLVGGAIAAFVFHLLGK